MCKALISSDFNLNNYKLGQKHKKHKFGNYQKKIPLTLLAYKSSQTIA